MLILSRKVNEVIVIGGGQVKIMVTGYDPIRKQVKLGIDAPKNITVDRQEIHERKLAARK